ncbi:MAG: hypothetical protein NUV67_00845 [archaeon]|nr:hypothetical protein [archaeon]
MPRKIITVRELHGEKPPQNAQAYVDYLNAKLEGAAGPKAPRITLEELERARQLGKEFTRTKRPAQNPQKSSGIVLNEDVRLLERFAISLSRFDGGRKRVLGLLGDPGRIPLGLLEDAHKKLEHNLSHRGYAQVRAGYSQAELKRLAQIRDALAAELRRR